VPIRAVPAVIVVTCALDVAALPRAVDFLLLLRDGLCLGTLLCCAAVNQLFFRLCRVDVPNVPNTARQDRGKAER
jgi:hypothetical protein